MKYLKYEGNFSKFIKKAVMFFVVIITLFISGCQCDLSHKHYYDDRGVCVCGDDVAQQLTSLNEEYTSTEHEVSQEETYYYKFKAHQKGEIHFVLESDNVIFDRIEINADNMLQSIATRKEYNDKLYVFENNFTNEKMYYLKVTYEGQGTVKLIVKELFN